MTDGLRAGLAAPTTPVNVSHAFIRRVTHAIHTDTHPFHIAAGEERALIDNPYPALRDLSLLVLNVGFHLKLSPPPNMNAIVGALRATDKLQQLFVTAPFSQNPTEQLVVCREQAVHLASTLWEHGWPTWYAISYRHAQNTRWVYDVAPTVWRYQTLLMDIGAKSYLDGIEKYQHHMHLQTHLVAPLFFSPYVLVAENETILDLVIRRQDSKLTAVLAEEAEKNLPRMREWQRRQPIIPRIGNLTAYDIDIPNSYFARDIPVPLQLVPLIRRSPICQSPSSLVYSGGICSYEHEFACTNPLSPSTSPVPANELTPPPAQVDNSPSVCLSPPPAPAPAPTSTATSTPASTSTPTSQTMTSLTTASTPSPPTPSDLVPAASASLLLPTVTPPSSYQVDTTAVDAAQINPPYHPAFDTMAPDIMEPTKTAAATGLFSLRL